ncbi:hypothetical protein ACH5RR_041565 [Cinchona calisaya]|uniref:PHD finger protein MALE STERILITY 1-like ubiquitin-like domain-containing protein n=1 Tax=Cinchona calisaya TaxID=153742 RepID=A0ABD2XV52_9GENT
MAHLEKKIDHFFKNLLSRLRKLEFPSFYEKWGYKFRHGSFGIEKGRYYRALACLRSLDLDKIVTDFKNKGGKIKQTISKYRGTIRDIPFITISNLLQFMIGFGGRTQIQRKTEIQDNVEDETIGISKKDVAKDAVYLYRNVLLGHSGTDSVTLAATDVVDRKHFVKEWPLEEQDMNQLIAMSFKVLPNFDEMEKKLSRTLSPGVLVAVSPSTTIGGELKVAVQSALRDTYCIMDNVAVMEIGGLKEIKDDKVVSQCIKTGDPVWVRGAGRPGDRIKVSRRVWRLTVDCSFGTKYDDGRDC